MLRFLTPSHNRHDGRWTSEGDGIHIIGHLLVLFNSQRLQLFLFLCEETGTVLESRKLCNREHAKRNRGFCSAYGHAGANKFYYFILINGAPMSQS